MDISIGIMAYNEENNIGNLLQTLLRQKNNKINIKEIIIVSSGSTDKTDEIVKRFSKKSRKIKLIIQKERQGKASAINEFLKDVKSNILVLQSADTIPKKDTIERLCKHFRNKKIGIVGGRPIPVKNKNKFIESVAELQWLLHHKISLKNPKFGEIIAFRKIFKKIENTSVDEEHLAMLIKKEFKGIYEPKAIIYNNSPKTISDFLKQRRRIYCGHLRLKKKYSYKVSTFSNFFIIKEVLKNLDFKNLLNTSGAVLLEGYGRFLGIYDYYTKKKHYVWQIAKTSKR